jgi:hypothetical protein
MASNIQNAYNCFIKLNKIAICYNCYKKYYEKMDSNIKPCSCKKKYIHYCGDENCGWDCGVLSCGCIDVCRKACDGDYFNLDGDYS